MSPSHDCVPISSLPTAPPPPYTEFVAGLTLVPNSQTTRTPPPRLLPTPMPSRPQSPVIQVHHGGYGPTPLTSNQPLLPYAYYEARGSADARARSRFIGAILCVFGLWLLVAFAVGIEIVGEEGWFWGNWARRFWAFDGIVRYWLWTRISNSGVNLLSCD